MRIFKTANAVLLSLLLFSLAFGAVAYHHEIAPDIFTDEIIYTRVGIRTAGEGAMVWDSGETFDVHPPLYFLVEGAYFLLSSNSDLSLYAAGDVFQSVYHARLLNAFLAGLTAVLLFLFGRLLGGSPLGLALSLLFLLDPFAIRINRRAMLETLAALLTLAGMSVFMVHAIRPDRPARRQRLYVITAGLLLGASTLTKELMFVNLPALAVFGAWEYLRGYRRNLSSKESNRSIALPLKSLVVAAIALLTYSLYPLWMALVGSWGAYVDEKLLGIQRLLGLVQLTGWNRPEISLVNLLLDRLADYGTTYLILLLGGPALLVLLLTARQERYGRFLISWGVVLYPFFTFIALFGTANDQFFYYLLIPAMIFVVLAAWRIPRIIAWVKGQLPIDLGARETRLMKLALTACILGFMTLVLTFNLYQWISKFSLGQDNGYYQLKQFVEAQLPPDEPINATGDPVKFHYFFPNRPITVAGTPQEARLAGVHTFTLAPKDVDLGYGSITPELAGWIQSGGQQLFSFRGSSYGAITLYRVDYQTFGEGAGFRIDRDGSHWRSFAPAQSGYVYSFMAMLLGWILLLGTGGIGIEWITGLKSRRMRPTPPKTETSEPQGASSSTRQ